MKYLILIFLLIACTKAEIIEPEKTYQVRYFAACEGEVTITTPEPLDLKGGFDTTFTFPSGSHVEMYVYGEIDSVGYYVDGVLIDGCNGGSYYFSTYYLP